ncbi:Transporter of the major facilitator superfamily MFS_1 [Rhodospirillaceae bacterium LM-1]|nr:Transporter of the major facilitator superfamily MFS_1 [Rhodospirillaceae bacterium LM-1]
MGPACIVTVRERHLVRLEMKSKGLVVLLTAMVAIGPVSTDLYLPSLPAVMRAFNADVASAQLTLSAFMAGFGMMMLVYGPLSDRFGRRPVLLAGMLLYSLASIFCLFVPTIDMLILGRFLQAVGAACGPVLGRAVVRDVYGREGSARVLSYMASAMALAPAAAPILGGFLETWFGWRSNFIALMGFGSAMLLALFALLPETNQHRDPEALAPYRLLGNLLSLLKNRRFMGYTLTMSFSFAALFSFISGSAFVLIDVLGVAPGNFGFCFAAVVAGYMGGSLTAGRFTLRLGLDRMIGLGALLGAGAGLLLTALAIWGPAHWAGVVFPVSLLFFSVGLVLPNASAGAIGPFPQMAGAASSLLGFLQTGIGALAGVLAGHLHNGTAVPMAVIILAMAVACPLTYGLLIARDRSNR